MTWLKLRSANFGAWALVHFFIANVAIAERGAGFDLNTTIRPHSSNVVFGDPIYFEMTFTNRGQEDIEVPTPNPRSNTARFDFGFRIYNPETRLLIHEGRGGQGIPANFGDEPRKLAPGESARHYWIVYFPNVQDRKGIFWRSLHEGGKLTVRPVYFVGEYRNLVFVGDPHEIGVEARNEMELEFLEKWASIKGEGEAKGPTLADLGIPVSRPLNNHETSELARKIGGELKDLLRLSLTLQDLYTMPPEAEEAACPALIEWLRGQPEIKREALIQAARRIAETYEPKMFVTADALRDAQRNK